MIVANGGIAGEVSPNGLGQVRDYLELFPNARYFVVGYGTNDLGMWPEVERTSPRIIENLDGMVRAIRDGGRQPILLNVPYANESMFPRQVAEDLHRKRDYHNERLRAYCLENESRSSISPRSSGTSTSPTSCTRTRRGRRSSPRRSSGCWSRCERWIPSDSHPRPRQVTEGVPPGRASAMAQEPS